MQPTNCVMQGRIVAPTNHPSYAMLTRVYTLTSQLCGRAWLSSASPSDGGVEYLLQMGHGGDIAKTHLGARQFASLAHEESVYRFKTLDLEHITDDDLQRRLRGTLVVEYRVTTDPDSSSRWPSKIAADEAFDHTDPWRRPDAGQRDAPSRCMAYIPTPYGKSSGQAPNDALAYRVRMDRSGERFKPMKRGRSDSTDEAAYSPPATETASAAETDSVVPYYSSKVPRTRSAVKTSHL